MIVGGREPFAQIVSASGGLIPGGSPRGHATWHYFDASIGVGIEEECHRVAILDRDRDPMGRGDVDVVGPAHQAVTDVANECARDVRRIEPNPAARTYLKTGNSIGGKD